MNNLSILSNGSFLNCDHLRRLNLSTSRISQIENGAFQDIPQLEELSLDNNELNLTSFQLFDPVRSSLKTLYVHGNLAYRGAIFTNLTALERLGVDGSPEEGFNGGFSNLRNLTRLEILDKLTTITNDTFANLTGVPVEYLKLSSPFTLVNVSEMSFAHFIHLETLDLSYNEALSLTDAARSWYGLQFTNITTLILTKMVNCYLNDPKINSDCYKYLRSTRIKKIMLNKNNLVEIVSDKSLRLDYLEHLDLSYNRISSTSNFIYLRNLRYLDMSYQIKKYREKRFDGIGVNWQSMLPGSEEVNSRIKRLDQGTCVTPNYTTCVPRPVPVPLKTHCGVAPAHLRVLNITSALINYITFLPPILILGTTRVDTIICKSNGLSSLTGPLMIDRPRASIPVSLDLSDNQISCIMRDVLKFSVARGLIVGKFILSNNNLGNQLSAETDGTVFEQYRHLIELHLAKSSIRTLPAAVFSKVPNLEILNLSGNSLEMIEFDFSYLLGLKMMDLSYNLIVNLNYDTMQKMSDHFKKSNMSLNLIENPLQCSCETLESLNWMSEHRARMSNFDVNTCLYNGDYVRFANLEDLIIRNLNFECSKSLALKLSATLLGLTLLGTVVSVFLYRRR